MKYSTRFSDAIHIVVFIAAGGSDGDLSSAAIAKSLNKNQTQVRQIMAQLKRHHILDSVPGHVCPQLVKDPAELDLATIYQAVDGGDLLHFNNETNTECRIGEGMPNALDLIFGQVQRAALAKLATYSIRDVFNQLDLSLLNFPPEKQETPN